MKKKVLSVILSVSMLASPSALVSVSAEETGFPEEFSAEVTNAPEESDVSSEDVNFLPEDVDSSEEASDVIDIGNEAPDSTEEVSDFAGQVSLLEDHYDEVQGVDEFADGEDDRQVDIVSEPKKSVYAYETVKSVDDFDLTGLSIKVTTGGSEEVISFTQNGEKKQDSNGNYYECKILSNRGEISEKLAAGNYSCYIGYYVGNVKKEVGTDLRLLPSVLTAENAIRQENGIYTATTDEMGVVKLVPDESGKFRIVDILKYDDDVEAGSYLILDGQSMEFIESSTLELEKGKTYYIYPISRLDLYPDEGAIEEHNFYVNPVGKENYGVCGENAAWKFENGVLTISGSGPMYDYRYNDSDTWPEIVKKETEKIVIEDCIASIGSYMFLYFSKLASIQIAESVEKIGNRALGRCENLQNIFIPKNVKTIEAIFSGNIKLDSIEVDKDNPYYSSADGVLYNKDQTDLVFVPEGKKECSISAKVVSVNGRDLTDLGEDTFPYAFWLCRRVLMNENSALQSITVASDNPVLTSVDGVLYTKDKSILLACPTKKQNLVVEEETKIIGCDAFSGCKELVSVSLPSGLETICSDGFSGCTSLKEIEIPENASLEDDSFTEKDTTLLRVHPNSDGQRYAKENGFKYEVIHPHSWDDGVVTKAATCTEDGIRTYTCSTGGETRTEAIPATGHKQVQDEAIPATCEKEGKTEGSHCSVCGTIIKEQETIPALGHTWDNGKITREAACTADGEKTFTCTVCQKTRTEAIPATGHKYGEYTVTKEPTIFTVGTESRECAVCHNKEEREIPKLTARVKLISKTLPMQVKKSVSGQKLIVDKNPSDSIVSLKTSNGKTVAVNNKTFKITAKKAGKAVITVTMKSGATSKITINVKKGKVATTTIIGVKKKLTIRKGKKLTLKPVLSPITSTDQLTYSSSDEEIATVSSKGVIRAIKKGKVKVKVKAGKKTVTCVVTVK